MAYIHRHWIFSFSAKIISSLDSEEWKSLNCLEMMEVFPALRGHRILVSLGDTTVVAFINLRYQATLPLQDSETSPSMGTSQPAFTQSSSDWTENWTSCISRRMETTPSSGSDDLNGLWEGRDEVLHLRRRFSLPNFSLKEARCSGPWLGTVYEKSLCH